MLYFFRRGEAALSCETRLNPDGQGHQLVVTEHGQARIESFVDLPKLLSREHELVQPWRAQGWRELGQPARTPVDPWPWSR